MNPGHSANIASRRDFLATGAAAFAGTALAGSSLAAVHATSSDELKVALVGCGARGAGAATHALSTDGPVKLWAMADAFEDRLENCLENLQRGTLKGRYDVTGTEGVAERIDVPKERRFVGLDAYRKAIDAVDVVLIAGPPGFRPQHFEYAVKAGKHVFMEKPVATDAPGIRRVMAAAKEAKNKNLKVGVGLQRHHQKSYLEAIPRIQDGELGDLIVLRCYWKGGMPAKSPHPRGDRGELEHQVANWYFFTWLSGDHICEQHIHNLDVCNWVMQAQPIEAEGMGGRQVRTGKEYGNIYDHHAVEFTYPGGVKMFSQCQQIPNTDGRVVEFVHGTKGQIELGNVAKLQLYGKKLERIAAGKGRAANAYQVELDDIFRAIRNDKPYNEAENGALSSMTAIMGRMATYTGKRVSWDAAYNSTDSITTDAETWDAKAPILPKEDGFYPVAMPGVTTLV